MKTLDALVSVIIPVYNMGDSLQTSIRSLLEQDYDNLEVILVDDGSSDDSLDICRKIAQTDQRVSYIHTENRGSGPARNTGIAHSRGKYLYFPDADDYLADNAISTLVKAMSDDGVDLVVCGYREMTRNGALLKEKKYAPFVQDGQAVRNDYAEFFAMEQRFSIQGAPWNKLFDAQTVRKNNIQYPSLRRHQDEGFISRYMNVAKGVKFIPDVLYTYYPNSLQLEWKKYPVDYYRAVKGLSEVWDETVCKWNNGYNSSVAKGEIISKYIKAFELSFSPKMNMGFFERCKWMKKVCAETAFDKNSLVNAYGAYQKLVLISAKCRQYWCMVALAKLGAIKRGSMQGR